jgi:hypothetical protein
MTNAKRRESVSKSKQARPAGAPASSTRRRTTAMAPPAKKVAKSASTAQKAAPKRQPVEARRKGPLTVATPKARSAKAAPSTRHLESAVRERAIEGSLLVDATKLAKLAPRSEAPAQVLGDNQVGVFLRGLFKEPSPDAQAPALVPKLAVASVAERMSQLRLHVTRKRTEVPIAGVGGETRVSDIVLVCDTYSGLIVEFALVTTDRSTEDVVAELIHNAAAKLVAADAAARVKALGLRPAADLAAQ